MTTVQVTSVTKDSPGAGQVTIVGTYSEVAVTNPAQQVTVGDIPSINTSWSRHVRLTNTILQVLRNGANGVAFALSSLSKIAYALEATLTFAPKINTQPVDDSCVASSTAADFTVVSASEVAQTYQWQYETKASATLTSTGTAPANNDTVTLGTKTYTFKTTLTGAANEVLIGASAAEALDNLKSAVNASAGAGTTYGTGTTANAEFMATTNTDTTQLFLARLSGTAGNAYATTEVSSQLSFGGATASGGGTWTNASGTVNGCAYTNGTTATLTATPTATDMTGTEHRCVITNSAGSTTSSSATITIT